MEAQFAAGWFPERRIGGVEPQSCMAAHSFRVISQFVYSFTTLSKLRRCLRSFFHIHDPKCSVLFRNILEKTFPQLQNN